MLTSVAPRRPLRTVLTATLALAAAAAAPLLAPTEAHAADLVVDGFDRTVATGWGSAGAGRAWTTSGGGTISVSSSAGRVVGLPANRTFKASQTSVSALDVAVAAQLQVSTGKDLQYSIESRRQADGSSYSARLRLDGNGKASLELMRSRAGALSFLKGATRADLGSVAGTPLVLRLSTVSTSPVVVQAKLYPAGTSEPGWQLTALDSAAAAVTSAGTTGLMVYNGPSNGAVDVTTGSFSTRDSTALADVLTDSAPAATPALDLTHGADPVGSATYPAPSDALYVSPDGSDSGTGSLTSPFQTVTKALAKNSNGQTIVLRAGTYHESVLVPPGHAATIQPYPGEAVWFDGTRVVDGFAASGSAFKAPWNVKFDHSPTYTKGAPDGTTDGWQFVNPAYPMAAYPDMVWLNNVEQKQVKSLGLVTEGTFFVDETYGNLYLGSDPTGKTVRAADLQSAFSLRAPGTVLRGFGIRRYADSVWQQGVVTSYFENMTLDNMTVRDSATGGIGMYKPGSTIKNTTVDGSGQLGIQANQADGLVLDNVSVTDSNDERFNPAPSAGGIKITQTRGMTLRSSEILRTTGNGFWTDQSVYDLTLAGNEILNGTRYGVVLEISSVAKVVNNVIANNAWDGIMVQNTNKVDIWNNTVVNNRRAVYFAQDSRRIEQLSVSGHDMRRNQPDLTMPWVLGDSTVSNNVLAAGAGAPAVLAVETYEHLFNASDIRVRVNGNAYAQTALGAPNAAVIWARKGAEPEPFVLLEDFRGTTYQEKSSVHAVMASPVDSQYRVKDLISAKAATVAQPLPATLATKAGQATGAQQLGAFDRPAS